MGEDEELLRVNPAEPAEGITPKGRAGRDSGGGRERRGDRRSFRRVADYFRTLAKAAEQTNERLLRNGAPFRFCVYRGENNRVMLDMVELGAAGTVVRVVRRDINDEDFDRWIEDIAGGEGMMVDSTA